MKKKIALLLAVSCLAASLVGCGAKKESGGDLNENGMPQSLEVFAPLGGSAVKGGATSNNDITSFQLMEELTGCHVEWVHPASDGLDEQFNLLMASGKYPDVIVYGWQNIPGGAKSYADDDIILPLKDLMEENMPNLTAFNTEHPDVLKEYSDDASEVYYIPFIRGDERLKVFQGPQIREDWLDKLGLSIPKTTDELYTVLKAFKTQDPNGNGEADEIPMTGIQFETESFGIGNLAWAFGTHYKFYVEDETVKYGIMEDRFKEALTYIQKLYSEGLIDVDYLLNDREKMDAKVMNNRAGFLYSFQPNKFYASMNDGIRKITGIPHLTGPYGDTTCFNSSYTQTVTQLSAVITTSNPQPAATLKWLDAFFGEEGAMNMNFGKEGESYTMEDGYPKLTDYILNNPDGKDKTEMIGMNIGVQESTFPALQDWRYYEQTLSPWSVDAINTWAEVDKSGVMPPVNLTSEESAEVTQIMSQVNTFVLENINKIVIGQLDISELDSIRERVKGMGIEKVLSIYNDAYTRYQKR